MHGQELRDEIARMLKALRKAGYKNHKLIRHKYFTSYKCDNAQDALVWVVYDYQVTVKELKDFLSEVPDDLLVDFWYDEDYGSTTISFNSEVKVPDETWYNKVNELHKRLLTDKKQQEKELQLEPIRKKVINKEELTIQELDFLFNK